MTKEEIKSFAKALSVIRWARNVEFSVPTNQLRAYAVKLEAEIKNILGEYLFEKIEKEMHKQSKQK